MSNLFPQDQSSEPYARAWIQQGQGALNYMEVFIDFGYEEEFAADLAIKAEAARNDNDQIKAILKDVICNAPIKPIK